MTIRTGIEGSVRIVAKCAWARSCSAGSQGKGECTEEKPQEELLLRSHFSP
jgi:hypothetical protein